MDPRPHTAADDPLSDVVVTAVAAASPQPGVRLDVRPFLKSRKTRRFMGLQDQLATLAAGRAVQAAGLGRDAGGEACGLYWSVGYIPFEAEDIDALMSASLDEAGAFSMAHFSTTGLRSVPPLLTFRCLPNMPAFHISSNFNIQGPYVVTYPGPGQLYLALEEALWALREGIIRRALVGGVAHQQNFLVRHLMGRLGGDVEALTDAAACVLLERSEDAAARGAQPVARLVELSIDYAPRDPFSVDAEHHDSAGGPERELGAASLFVDLAEAVAGEGGELGHDLESRDGIRASSRWEVLR